MPSASVWGVVRAARRWVNRRSSHSDESSHGVASSDPTTSPTGDEEQQLQLEPLNPTQQEDCDPQLKSKANRKRDPGCVLQNIHKMNGFSRSNLSKSNKDTCLMKESPFRIFRAAESGQVALVEHIFRQESDSLKMVNSRGRNVVHVAAMKDQSVVLQALINYGADINTRDEEGNTPLHLAVENEALDAIDILITSGADTSVLNNRRLAAIHLATELNKVKVLERLVSHCRKIDIRQPGDHGRTALHIAAIHDYADCAKILLSELGACPRQTCDNGFYPIHEAARHASTNTMKVFLDSSDTLGIKRQEMMNFCDAEGNVPLHSAVHSGDVEAVELCLRSGAKISSQQHDLSTPVHLAAAQGTLHLVRLMFELQPDETRLILVTEDAQKMTPLHCAAMFDHSHVVQYLVAQGADLEARDREGRTALLLAASRSAWKTVHALLGLNSNIKVVDNCNRNVLHLIILNGGRLEEFSQELTQVSQDLIVLLNERDSMGCSPLHYASRQGHIHSLRGLLILGACVSLKNNQNENSLHFAARYGRFQTVRQLLDSDKGAAIINESDGNGLTPLHIASQQGHTRVVQFLLNRGALLHRDHLGRTPLHLAAIAGHTDTLRLLLSIHSHLLDQQDKDGNTALHLATMENKPNVISLLLTLNCKLLPNSKSLYPIDYAIHYKNHEAALALVTHQARGDEIMLQRSERTPCVMIALINALPRITEAVLDRCIVKANCKSDSKSFYVKYSFRFLQMPAERLDMYRKLHNDPKWKPEPLCAMNAMVRNGRVHLLSHPLSQKFLEFKWHSYGMYFHLANLLLYSLFLCCVTVFSSEVMVSPRWILPSLNESLPSLSETKENVTTPTPHRIDRLSKEYFQTSNAFLTYLCGIFIVVYIGVSALRECCHMVHQKWRYFGDISNIIAWVLYTTSAVMVAPVFYGSFEPFNYSCAAFATFLCWFNLLIYLQRFDHVGIYVVMFLEILKTLLKVLLVFSVLIIAFGLAFYILMSDDNHIAFSRAPISFLRTFSMMLGEIDFLGTFVRPFYASDSSRSSNSRLQLPYTTFLMLCVFMVLMPILLMNLLIGLAVGDIESVRRNAQLKRLAMQVEMHTDLERRLPEFILKCVDKMELIEYPNRCCEKSGFIGGLLNRLVKNPFVENGNSRLLPKTQRDSQKDLTSTDVEHVAVDSGTDDLITSEDRLFEEIYNQKRKLREITAAIESQTLLLRLVVQKMEIKTEADDLDEGVSHEDVRCSSQGEFRIWSNNNRNNQLAFLRRTSAIGAPKV